MTLIERLTAPGPKRILALDGGGVRGLVTLGFLERLERLLRERYGRPDYRLSDYFDLIGGTSVGSSMAAGKGRPFPARIRSSSRIELEPSERVHDEPP